MIKFQDSEVDGGTEPVALLSDFGCAKRITSTGSVPYPGSWRSPIPEVAKSTWAVVRRNVGGSTDPAPPRPQVTTTADVWLLGRNVLPRLLREVPEGARAKVQELLDATTNEEPKARPAMRTLLQDFSTLLMQAAGTA